MSTQQEDTPKAGDASKPRSKKAIQVVTQVASSGPLPVIEGTQMICEDQKPVQFANVSEVPVSVEEHVYSVGQKSGDGDEVRRDIALTIVKN